MRMNELSGSIILCLEKHLEQGMSTLVKGNYLGGASVGTGARHTDSNKFVGAP
jgi:hypothetical protein